MSAALPVFGAWSPRYEKAPIVRFVRPELAGCRLRPPGRSAVDLVDGAGLRRRVPSDTVFRRLFRPECRIVDCIEVERIAVGPPLASGTMLVRGHASEDVYIVDMGRKRRLTFEAMAKYAFDGDRVFVIRQALVDAIACGAPWQ